MRNRLVSAVSISILLAIPLMLGSVARAGGPGISYIASPPAGHHVKIDVRPAKLCSVSTLKGATCVPASDVLGPHRRLANISGLLWLLGTADLDGSEHVLIIGRNGPARDFMAGLLHLAGQKEVSILSTRVRDAVKDGADAGPGFSRNTTREKVYQSPMRSDQIVLRNELVRAVRSSMPPQLIDGRSEVEYWGGGTRAVRGGHLPGAQHSPLTDWPVQSGKTAPLTSGAEPMIVYAHDTFESIAYFARVVAAGVPARVYMEGWVGWASDGALPVDAATYPVRKAVAANFGTIEKTQEASISWFLMLALGIGAVAMPVLGFFVGRVSAQGR